ncbi:MAG: hypothetical protein H6925_01775 [Holosporaceae bacterium]|nr:MAG: hypothetical protein H6925_01775 [Holosporaceae bacterium]
MSGLSKSAGLVIIPKEEKVLKHIEFIAIDTRCALAIMVTEEEMLRIDLLICRMAFSQSTLVEASNYLSARLTGHTLSNAKSRITKRACIASRKA